MQTKPYAGPGTELLAESKVKEIPEEGETDDETPAEEPPSSPFMIRPTGGFRTSWDILTFLLLMYLAVMLPMRFGFNYEAKGFMAGFEFSIDILFAVDVLINFRTGYVDTKSGDEVMEFDRVWKNYVSGWFWLDIGSAFPPFLSMIVKENVDDLKSAKLLKTGRILKAFKVLRLSKLVKGAEDFQWCRRLSKVRTCRLDRG